MKERHHHSLVQLLRSSEKFYIQMSGEIEQDSLVVVEVIKSRITRQIWIVSSGMYWASPDAEKDSEWFFTDQPEVDEHDLLSMAELDAVQISESEFEDLWAKALIV